MATMDPLTSQELEFLRDMGGPKSMADIRKLIRMYVYGDPGVGKTDLIAKICLELGLKPLWVWTDSGYSTVLKYPELAERTWFIPFESLSQVRMMAQANFEGIEPFCNYDALVWDTTSTAINNVLRNLVKLKKFPKEQPDPSVEGWPHYRMAEANMKDTVEVLSKSSMHIFYSAHIREPSDKDQQKKKFAIRPAGPEACYRTVAQEANLIGWLYKEKQPGQAGERLIQFEPTLTETAKTQVPTITETTHKVKLVPELISKYVNS